MFESILNWNATVEKYIKKCEKFSLVQNFANHPRIPVTLKFKCSEKIKISTKFIFTIALHKGSYLLHWKPDSVKIEMNEKISSSNTHTDLALE